MGELIRIILIIVVVLIILAFVGITPYEVGAFVGSLFGMVGEFLRGIVAGRG